MYEPSQVDLEMQRRVIDGGYDSDLDRDEVAATLVRHREHVGQLLPVVVA